MTKDYEADSIADETRRDVERQTQSPYTRDEFIAVESDRWRKLNPYQSDDVDTPMEAVMAAAAAERTGITWRVDNICPTCQCNQGWERCINGRMCLKCGDFVPDIIIRCPECDELCRSFALDGRGVCMKHGVVERRMQSPYTRAEFVARELATRGSTNADRAEWNAQAAERTGITWHQEPEPTRPLFNRITLEDKMRAYFDLGKSTEGGRLDDLAKRIEDMRSLLGSRILSLEYHEDWAKSQIKNLTLLAADAREAIGELGVRLTAAETKIGQLDNSQLAEVDYEERLNEWRGQIDERVTSLEIRDSTGAKTVYHAIGERAKDEIRTLIRETANDECDTTVERINSCESLLESSTMRVDQIEHVTQSLDYRLKGLTSRVITLESASNVNVLQRVTRIESEWKIEGQKLTTDRAKLRSFVVDGVGKDIERLSQKVETLNVNLLETGSRVGHLGDEVRRLDADMALIRDAVCPPQGTAVRADDGAHPADVLADSVKLRSPIFDPVHGVARVTAPAVDWPDPTPTMLESLVFEAIWQTIKTWDIAVPGAYSGYCEATGNHVRAIMDAIRGWSMQADRLDKHAEHIRQTRDALRAACLELGADASWSDDTNLADVVSKVLMPHLTDSRAPLTFDDWWTHYTRSGIYLGNGINVDRESTTGNALYRYLRQTWNAAQGRATIHDFAPDTDAPGTPEAVDAPANKTTTATVIDDTLVLDFDGPIVPKQTAESPVFKAVWSVIEGWFERRGEPVTGREVLSILRAIRDAGIATSGARHDDLAYALGRAYVALKDLEPYEPKVADEEMEAIRQVLGNNYRDWLRPREAG